VFFFSYALKEIPPKGTYNVNQFSFGVNITTLTLSEHYRLDRSGAWYAVSKSDARFT